MGIVAVLRETSVMTQVGKQSPWDWEERNFVK